MIIDFDGIEGIFSRNKPLREHDYLIAAGDHSFDVTRHIFLSFFLFYINLSILRDVVLSFFFLSDTRKAWFYA